MFRSHSRSSATSDAAASALPPANPPATGIPLAMWIAAARSTPWCAPSTRPARTAMLDSSSGAPEQSRSPMGSTETDQASASLTVTSSYRLIAW